MAKKHGVVTKDSTKKQKEAAIAAGDPVEVATLLIKFLADASGADVTNATDVQAIRCEGHRGLVLAFNQEGSTKFVLLSMTAGGGIEWGKLYLAEEFDPKQHPFVTKHDLHGVPNEEGWEMISTDWSPS